MAKIIILIGKTGSGKSTLANVISGTNEFAESGSSTSVTKEIKKGEFSDSGINYAVIDTVGIGDTQLRKEEVLDKIAEAVYLARDGISQVLFVTNGRFDQFEMSIYSLLSTIIFDKSVTSYTTIVRTRFPKFEDKEERAKDIEEMKSSEGELSNVIKSCQERVVHIDNPSLDIDVADDESDDEIEERKRTIGINKKIRNKSQKKLLEHLQKKCLEQEKVYKPQKLEELNKEIDWYMEKKEETRAKLIEKEKKRLEEIKKQEEVKSVSKQSSTVEEIEDSRSRIEINLSIDVKNNETKLGAEKEGKQIDSNRNLESNRKIFTKLRIATLENEIKELEETKKLIEEIQETDEIIRQRVLKHIFNNYDEITQVVGGSNFLSSIIGSEDNSFAVNKLSFAELKRKVEKLEKELKEKGGNDQSLEQIKTELDKKEKELLKLKKQLLENEEIKEKWESRGFNIQQAKEWADVLGNNFSSENDASFCAWLRDTKSIITERALGKNEVEQLRIEYDPQQENKFSGTKTILLIGRSGRGKSTLANVLLNKNNNFEEVFKESSGSVSETKKIQFEQFENNNVNYLVIDTLGIGDTKMSDNEVLDILAEVVYLVRDGVSQVFFVIDGRFDQYEMATYNLLRTIIFDTDITKHTTIARTRFEGFKSKKKCLEDINLMIGIGGELAEIIRSCQERVVHIDNPSIEVNDDEELKSNKRKRVKSREKVIEYLNKNNCQGIPYKPPKLEKLSKEIADDYFEYLKKKEELEEELKKIKANTVVSTNIQPTKTQYGEDKMEKVLDVDNEVESRVESAIEKKQEVNDSLAIGERIKELEDKKTRLKREITEKERIIRQKVLKHIFNNYDGVSNEMGGGIFLASVTEDNNNWESIHPIFTNKQLILEWKSNGFDYEEVQKWRSILGNNFNLEKDIGFCAWLRDEEKLDTTERIKEINQNINDEELKQLRERYKSKVAQQALRNKHLQLYQLLQANPQYQTKILQQEAVRKMQLQQQQAAILMPSQLAKGGNSQIQQEKEQKFSDRQQNVHHPFFNELTQKWQESSFTTEDIREWTDTGLKLTDTDFVVWLRDIKQFTPEQVLNHGNEQELRQEYQNYQQSQIQIPTK
ncbi:MAG: 50S ribosome-binding GTPase [Candidatus Moeniiplasma glomeromycotorum]|nr:50S ribosome-binding GTPase [Candidatus Moeniiplasma glomeromycotorum]MCE8169333.1 50S ribosome-binding GTPase [Candidatus Moeniiplasma glomeromycotorum]